MPPQLLVAGFQGLRACSQPGFLVVSWQKKESWCMKMKFNEILLRRRRELGLSQEELAERLGVSRQAVSKWETGEASPDLVKLQALAVALDISLDVLCGLKEKEERTAEAEVQKGKAEWSWKWAIVPIAMTAILAIVLISIFGKSDVRELPDTITVTGVQFAYVDGALQYSLTPSYVDPDCAYSITFAGGDKVYTYEAALEGGVCTGSAAVSPPDSYAGGYTISLCIDNGEEARAIALATDFSGNGNFTSWTPVE